MITALIQLILAAGEDIPAIIASITQLMNTGASGNGPTADAIATAYEQARTTNQTIQATAS